MNNELLWQEMAVLQIIGKHIYLSRHSEVKGPNGGNEAWDDEGDDQALQHVQEQLPWVAHIAETEYMCLPHILSHNTLVKTFMLSLIRSQKEKSI